MDQATMQKWFENYATWRKEATEEMKLILTELGRKESPYDKFHLHDDGSIFWEWLHKDGKRNEFQSCWLKQKVTAWKDSKYFVEI